MSSFPVKCSESTKLRAIAPCNLLPKNSSPRLKHYALEWRSQAVIDKVQENNGGRADTHDRHR
ncbi:MAG TPA: hypothetical protein V6D33_00265 [Cyanophyceae cyanobacterium]